MFKYKGLILISFLSLSLAGCSTSLEDQNQTELNDSNVPTSRQPDYKAATKTYAELTIIYTRNQHLYLAKTKLITAQKLSKEYGYDLAIVNYAAGYYYQAIGADNLAKKFYVNALDIDEDNSQSINLYGQFVCQAESNYPKAIELFKRSLSLPSNNNMSQTLFLYSECMYKKGDKLEALKLMEKSNRFQSGSSSAKLQLAKMYLEQKMYKKCYRVIYGMRDNSDFFNNVDVLNIRLKLAEYAHNKNEAASVRLILSSNQFNEKNMNEFFSVSDKEAIKA